MRRLGLVARADNTGLGNQTYEFYRHMRPCKTMVVDISMLNGNPQYPERYPGAQFVQGFPTVADIAQFLDGLDVIFVAESPYNYSLYAMARERGIKIALQENYEFFDWYWYPNHPKPDILISPSRWHYDDVDNWAQNNGVRHVYLHAPVNRTLLPYERKLQARRFLHPVGKPAAHDRNGTEDVLAAVKLLPKDLDVEIILTCQDEQACAVYREAVDWESDNWDERISVEYTGAVTNYWTVYDGMDVLLLPRRYGGNCLPLNEALSRGMPAIMPDLSPNNTFLPDSWLVPAVKSSEFAPRTIIDIHSVRPEDLCNKIVEFAEMGFLDMRDHSKTADMIARTIDWKVMASQYADVLESL